MQINDVFSRNIDYGTEIQTWLDERRRTMEAQKAAAQKAAEEQQYERQMDKRKFKLDQRKQTAVEEMDSVQMANYNSLIKSRNLADKMLKRGNQYMEIPDPLDPKKTLKVTTKQYLDYANREIQKAKGGKEEDGSLKNQWITELPVEINDRFQKMTSDEEGDYREPTTSEIDLFNRYAADEGLQAVPFRLRFINNWGRDKDITLPVMYQKGQKLDVRAIYDEMIRRGFSKKEAMDTLTANREYINKVMEGY